MCVWGINTICLSLFGSTDEDVQDTRKRKKKAHCQETKHTIKPGLDKKQMLELSGNITMINRLKAVVGKLNNKYEHIKNFSRDGNRRGKKWGFWHKMTM